MALTDLLDCTVDVVTGTETVDPTTRRPVTGVTVRHADVPAAFVQRTPRSTVYDEAGAVITDYDCVLTVPVTEGDLVTSKAGSTTGTFIVTGEAAVRVRRTTGVVHHYTAPCRRT